MAPWILLTLILPLAAATPGRTGTPVPERLARLEASDALPLPHAAVHELTPLQREIRRVLERARARREELLSTALGAEALPVALAEWRRATRLQVLAVQERHARREGRPEMASRIRAEIDALRTAPLATR